MSEITDTRRRWLALYVLCLASLMIVLDVTIVGVALPSIRTDLGFSETSLAWVVNAYLLTSCSAGGSATSSGIAGSSSSGSRPSPWPRSPVGWRRHSGSW
jgi:MFS family permease